MLIEEFIPLAQQTTFKIGGPARYLAHTTQDDDLYELADFAERAGMPVTVIGGGSNLLAPDEGFRGIVVRVANTTVDWHEDGDVVHAIVSAGVSWDTFVAAAVMRGFWGPENLSGIPGTLGGAVVQNIGAYGVELSNMIEWVEAFHLPSRVVKRFKQTDCAFGYRDSVWKHRGGDDFVILRAALRLSKRGVPNIAYKDLARNFAGVPTHILRPSDIRHAVLEIRKGKFPDLSYYGTAGSFFKNPVVARDIFDRIFAQFPQIPFYFLDTQTVKLSAAWLIDIAADMRGKRIGDVGTWMAQALVVVNYGNATARDVYAFAEMIKKTVQKKTGITLEPEVVIMSNSSRLRAE